MSDRRAVVSQTTRPSSEKGRQSAAASRGASAFTSQASGPKPTGEFVSGVLHSAGLPLDEHSRTFFEPRFGHDFGKVRVHTDARAADSADTLLADAYTAGDHIVFGAGQYAPASSKGRALLAHELAHVAQQAVPQSLSVSLRVSRLGPVAEQAAENECATSGSAFRPHASRSRAWCHSSCNHEDSRREAIAGWGGTDEEAIYARLRIAGDEEKNAVLGDPVLMQERQDDLSPRGEWGTVRWDHWCVRRVARPCRVRRMGHRRGRNLKPLRRRRPSNSNARWNAARCSWSCAMSFSDDEAGAGAGH
ncbi:MAG: DUF4157 domain-containing protein [Burkholderiales bacterium]|nr:DUF4157 domain-containing protein [Burkholderiales bacterium]